MMVKQVMWLVKTKGMSDNEIERHSHSSPNMDEANSFVVPALWP